MYKTLYTTGKTAFSLALIKKTEPELETRIPGSPSWTVAPRHGFEPRFTAPKAAVLPLDDRGKSVLQDEALLQCSVALRAAATLMLSSLVEANLGRCRARASNPSCGTYVSHVGSTPTSFRQIPEAGGPITIFS